MTYRREIDGLRAVAVLGVILYHFAIPGFSGGYVGVDVFFVISGYLITRILVDDLRAGTFSIVRFYKRRILRIMPALLVVLAATTLAAWMLLGPPSFAEYSRTLTATSTFVANIYFSQQADYFAPAAASVPLLHMWSLAVEEQFYLFFPPLLFFVWKLGIRWVGMGLIVIILASFAYVLWGQFAEIEGLFFQTRARAWELAIGAGCALLPAFSNEAIARRASDLGLIAIACAIGFGGWIDPSFSQIWVAIPVLGTALVILGPKTALAARLLSTRVLVGIGLISYSAYLIHQPVSAFHHIITVERAPMITRMGLIAVVLALAYLSYRFVETPFRGARARSVHGAPLFLGTLAAVFAFVAVGVYGHANRGVPSRFAADPELLAYSETAISSPIRAACHTEGASYLSPSAACIHGDGPLGMAVLGDSHGVELAAAIGNALAPEMSVLHLTFSACYPFFEHPGNNPDCEAWTMEALEVLRNTPDIETVILAYRVHSHMYGNHPGAYPEILRDNAARPADEVAADLGAIADVLIAAGKRVVIVASAPDLPRHIEDLVFVQGTVMGEGISGASRAWWDQRREGAFADAVAAGAELFDTTPLFCDDVDCYAGRDGVSFYFDDDHPSVAGAQMIADAMMDAIAR